MWSNRRWYHHYRPCHHSFCCYFNWIILKMFIEILSWTPKAVAMTNNFTEIIKDNQCKLQQWIVVVPLGTIWHEYKWNEWMIIIRWWCRWWDEMRWCMYLNPNAGYTALLYVRSINNFRIEGIKRSIHYHLKMTNDKISRVYFFCISPSTKAYRYECWLLYNACTWQQFVITISNIHTVCCTQSLLTIEFLIWPFVVAAAAAG